MNLLQTAKATERTAAAKRTLDVDDLPVGVVHDGHVKRTGRTAVLTQAAVGIFSGKVDLLSKGVLDLVLVGCFPAREKFKQLNLLMDQNLVNLR